MFRLLNVLAVLGLVGTAAWAYSVKYETIYYAEQVRKLERRIQKERDAVAILKAEWQLLNGPARVQALNERVLGLRPLEATQIVRAEDLPFRREGEDRLAQTLDQLLATGTIARPAPRPAPAAGSR